MYRWKAAWIIAVVAIATVVSLVSIASAGNVKWGAAQSWSDAHLDSGQQVALTTSWQAFTATKEFTTLILCNEETSSGTVYLSFGDNGGYHASGSNPSAPTANDEDVAEQIPPGPRCRTLTDLYTTKFWLRGSSGGESYNAAVR